MLADAVELGAGEEGDDELLLGVDGGLGEGDCDDGGG